MPALSPDYGAGLSLPTQDQILAVMNECNCSEQKAIKALKLYNNDIERAKHHQRLWGKYLRTNSSRPSRAHTPARVSSRAVTPKIEAPRQRQERNADVVTLHDESDSSPEVEEVRSRPNIASTVLEDLRTQLASSIMEPNHAFQASGSSLQVPGVENPPPEQLNTLRQNRNERKSDVNAPNGTRNLASNLPTEHTNSGYPGNSESLQEWNFILQPLGRPAARAPVSEAHSSFSLTYLAQNIQHGANLKNIQSYLNDYDSNFIKKAINGEVQGYPAIFYIVARNDEAMLRAWVSYGGDVRAVHKASKTPLLAFAIAHGETIQGDMTLVVATLLGLGATSEVIPAEFYTPYYKDLPIDGPMRVDAINERTVWCTTAARKTLARTLNLSQRYYLWRAAKLKRATIRPRQVALHKKAEAILEIPYFLIGQTTASDRLLRKLLNHIMIPSARPLVMAFAGPSGHGKTELARRLGHLLSLDLEVVDCTIVKNEHDLFGARHPYKEAEKGTPLNNFLKDHEDKRCIVFLDEFEKTTTDIHQALLLPFDNGEYQDRRDRSKVNCSKTIWILATNALDEKIKTFCDRNEDIIRGEETTKEMLARQLSRELKKGFLDKFGAPITGRISDFIPFLEFSPGEQAVVAHKFLRELSHKVQEPTNLSEGPNERLLGDVRLHVKHDALVCMTLAEGEYLRDLGARSLSGAVKLIEDMLVDVYLKQRDEIVEGGKILDVVVDVHAGEISVAPLSSTL